MIIHWSWKFVILMIQTLFYPCLFPDPEKGGGYFLNEKWKIVPFLCIPAPANSAKATTVEVLWLTVSLAPFMVSEVLVTQDRAHRGADVKQGNCKGLTALCLHKSLSFQFLSHKTWLLFSSFLVCILTLLCFWDSSNITEIADRIQVVFLREVMTLVFMSDLADLFFFSPFVSVADNFPIHHHCHDRCSISILDCNLWGRKL